MKLLRSVASTTAAAAIVASSLPSTYPPSPTSSSFRKSTESRFLPASPLLASSGLGLSKSFSPPISALNMDTYKPSSQGDLALPELMTEFMVDMKCEGCVKNVKNKLGTVEGVKNIEVDLDNQVVRILGSTPVKLLEEALGQTGLKARLIGQGVPEDFLISAAVAEFKGPEVFGVVRLAQVSMELARIEANFSGLSPGKHGWSINEFGDLTRGAASTGKAYNPGSETQPLGDLGTLDANEKGEAFYSGAKRNLKIGDLIGRSIAIYGTEDKSDPGLMAAVIARSAGVGENYKKLCTCDGTTIWEATNGDFVSRNMSLSKEERLQRLKGMSLGATSSAPAASVSAVGSPGQGGRPSQPGRASGALFTTDPDEALKRKRNGKECAESHSHKKRKKEVSLGSSGESFSPPGVLSETIFCDRGKYIPKNDRERLWEAVGVLNNFIVPSLSSLGGERPGWMLAPVSENARLEKMADDVNREIERLKKEIRALQAIHEQTVSEADRTAKQRDTARRLFGEVASYSMRLRSQLDGYADRALQRFIEDDYLGEVVLNVASKQVQMGWNQCRLEVRRRLADPSIERKEPPGAGMRETDEGAWGDPDDPPLDYYWPDPIPKFGSPLRIGQEPDWSFVKKVAIMDGSSSKQKKRYEAETDQEGSADDLEEEQGSERPEDDDHA